MKRKVIVALLLAAVLSVNCVFVEKTDHQTVNSIIGDLSFVKKYGYTPSADTDEKIRIKTHLEYVEALLRKRDMSGWSEMLKQRRNRLLNLLHDYRLAGRFPSNYDHPGERKPCFIDRNGNICAVGYLIEQTSGRDAAEKINAKHQYETIYEMEGDTEVSEWISSSGLTEEECAMIQFAYEFHDNSNFIPPPYAYFSSFFTGINVSMITLNSIEIVRAKKTKAIPISGIITGSLQCLNGVVKMYVPDHNYYDYTFTRFQAVSMLNIGLGTATVLLSSWNLISNRHSPSGRSMNWGLYSYPISGKSNAMVLGFTKKI